MEENKRISFDDLGNGGLFYESENKTKINL